MKLKKLAVAGMMVVMAAGMAACSKKDKDNNNTQKEQTNIELTDIRDAVKKAYGEDYIPNMEYDDIFIEETLDIDKDEYESIIAEGPLVSFHIDNFIAVKAKPGKADDVEEDLKEYRNSLINDTMMYPTNAIKIQASQVIRHDNYVFFVCLGVIDVDTSNGDVSDEEILKQAQEKNKIAVDTINEFFN